MKTSFDAVASTVEPLTHEKGHLMYNGQEPWSQNEQFVYTLNKGHPYVTKICSPRVAAIEGFHRTSF